MERNTSTTIGRLQFGDRFHKASDKKKEVWQLLNYGNRKYSCKRDTDRHPTEFKPDLNVVFLRSTNN